MATRYEKKRQILHLTLLNPYGLILKPVFGRHGEFLATVCTTGCKDATAIGSAHALTESVLVDALAV